MASQEKIHVVGVTDNETCVVVIFDDPEVAALAASELGMIMQRGGTCGRDRAPCAAMQRARGLTLCNVDDATDEKWNKELAAAAAEKGMSIDALVCEMKENVEASFDLVADPDLNRKEVQTDEDSDT